MTVRIGRNFHVIHVTDDLKQLDHWYYDVFSCQRFMPESYLAAEHRDASLVLIGDVCIEPLAPKFSVADWETSPLGRFYRRHGRRFHSLAWYVDDGFAELHDKLRAAGVRCYGTAGVKLEDTADEGALFTHPRDTYTQLEFMSTPLDGPLRDPRLRAGWSPSWWADVHPLQIQNLSHVTVTTTSHTDARHLYVELFGGVVVHEGADDVLRADASYVLVGDLVVQFATPADESSPLAADMAAFHESIYCLTYKVRDLERASDHLRRRGVRFRQDGEDTLVSAPETTHGCVMAFTTHGVPGDPRPDWSTLPHGDEPYAEVFREL